MNYSFEQISDIVGGKLLASGSKSVIKNIIYDTRKISFAKTSVFIAFKGSKNDGHKYINEAYNKGVRNFIISKNLKLNLFKDSNVLLVDSSLMALQKLARHHRLKFHHPVIAITGSNGKTIVKEWLSKALSSHYNLVKSPKSFNSQIGVALSLLQINDAHELAIIEAGISKNNEMRFLEKMIQPDIGILTNLRDAHSSGFESKEAKLIEKLVLFKNAKIIIYNSDQELVNGVLKKSFEGKLFSWSTQDKNADVYIESILKGKKSSHIVFRHNDKVYKIEVPFSSQALLENLFHMISCMLYLKAPIDNIETIIQQFDQIQNRLEIKEGINHNILINDSYSLDMASMQLALEYQDQHANNLDKVVIFSEFDQPMNQPEVYDNLNQLFLEKSIEQIFAIGIQPQNKSAFQLDNIQFFDTIQSFLKESDYLSLTRKCILIKGARSYKLETIFQSMSKQDHQTILETNFSAIDHNLNVFKTFLKPETKIMAVIKAEAYGSGSDQMAQYLTQKDIDYLAVAITDEAVKIREAGCLLPIMVFNVQATNLAALWEHNLEPEIYSLKLLKELIKFSNQLKQEINIHLKFDSGMHRLGFVTEEIPIVLSLIQSNKFIGIKSIFSHLSAAENSIHDSFTIDQIEKFNQQYNQVASALNYKPLKHILNTSGISRFNTFQFDMVRLGLGLYGIDETKMLSDKLERVHSLKAHVLQIKKLQSGDTTGYNRSGMTDQEKTIAIVSIGYADGLIRKCGNGNYSMMVKGQFCPTIGNICMDVSMIDISKISDVSEGDEVIIFSQDLPVEKLAHACDTIAYEIISRIAPRVKRIYTYD